MCMAMSSSGSTLDLDTSEVIAELHFSTGGDTMYVHVKSAPPHLVNRQTTKTGATAFLESTHCCLSVFTCNYFPVVQPETADAFISFVLGRNCVKGGGLTYVALPFKWYIVLHK